MGKIVLENIEEDTLDRLRALASSTGRTPEEEAKRLISGALGAPLAEVLRRRELLERMRRTADLTPSDFGIDLTQLIREDRDR